MATEEVIWYQKNPSANGGGSQTSAASGYDWSLWQYDGDPCAGATPGAWANPTNATAGSLGQTDPATGKQKWLTSLLFGGASISGMWSMHDRLLHVGGFDGTLTTVQNVNGGADATVSRIYTDNAGNNHVRNSIWLEIYTTVGATAVTATVTYKNQAGVLKTATCQLGGTNFREAQRMIRVPLASGDIGVSAVVSVQLSASTGTAGNFGITVTHPLIDFSVCNGSPELYVAPIHGDASNSGTVAENAIECLPGACWTWVWTPMVVASASIPVLSPCCFTFVEK